MRGVNDRKGHGAKCVQIRTKDSRYEATMAARSYAQQFDVSYTEASFAGASGTLWRKWPGEYHPQKKRNAHFATFHVEIPKIPSSSSADGPTMPYAHTSGTRGTAMAEKKEKNKTKNGPRKPNSPGLPNLYHSLRTPIHPCMT